MLARAPPHDSACKGCGDADRVRDGSADRQHVLPACSILALAVQAAGHCSSLAVAWLKSLAWVCSLGSVLCSSLHSVAISWQVPSPLDLAEAHFHAGCLHHGYHRGHRCRECLLATRMRLSLCRLPISKSVTGLFLPVNIFL